LWDLWTVKLSHIACYRMFSQCLEMPWLSPGKARYKNFKLSLHLRKQCLTVPCSWIFGTAQLVFESCSRCSRCSHCSRYAAKAWRRSVGQLRWARNERQLPLQFSPQNLLAEFETSHRGFEVGQAGKSWQELARLHPPWRSCLECLIGYLLGWRTCRGKFRNRLFSHEAWTFHVPKHAKLQEHINESVSATHSFSHAVWQSKWFPVEGCVRGFLPLDSAHLPVRLYSKLLTTARFRTNAVHLTAW
jgi:hypothetical protein